MIQHHPLVEWIEGEGPARPDPVGLFLTVANEDYYSMPAALRPVVAEAFGWEGSESSPEARSRLVYVLDDVAEFGGMLLELLAVARGTTADETAEMLYRIREKNRAA